MNFQNLPAQLIILLCGWSFTLYLDRRAKHRAEAIKRKDYIISKIEDIADWLDKEISKDSFQPARTESSLAGMLTQIELKIIQFNSHVKKELLDPSKLSALRGVNLYQTVDTSNSNRDIENAAVTSNESAKQEPEHDLSFIYYEIRDHSSDLIEDIESNCNDYFFPENRFPQLPNNWIPHVFAFFFIALLTVACLSLYDLMHRTTKFTKPIHSVFTTLELPSTETKHS